jgi:hypothetical protein
VTVESKTSSVRIAEVSAENRRSELFSQLQQFREELLLSWFMGVEWLRDEDKLIILRQIP